MIDIPTESNTELASSALFSFLDNLNEGVVLLNTDGRIVYVNQVAQQLLQLYRPVQSLREIYELSGSAHTEAWDRWQTLLAAPSQAHVSTSLGNVDIQSKAFRWRQDNLLQLIINASTHIDALPEEDSRDALVAYIEELRRENRSLIRRVAQVERLQILSEASSEIARGLEQQDVLKAMGTYMSQAVSAIGYSIYEWSEDQAQISFVLDMTRHPKSVVEANKGTFLVRDHTILRQLLENNTLLISDGGEYLPGTPLWSQSGLSYSVVMLPIFSGGLPFGIVALAKSSNSGDLDEHELQLLATIINQAGVALEKVRLFDSAIDRENFLSSLGRVSLAINGTLDLDRVLHTVCQESQIIFNIDGVYIWQLSEVDGQQSLVALASDNRSSTAFKGLCISASDQEYFASAIVQSGQSLFVNNFKHQDDLAVHLPQADSIEAVMGVPLVREGETIGVLVLVDRQQPERFGPRDLDRANSFAIQVAIALQNARLVTSLRTLNEDLDRRVIDRTKDLGQERDRVNILLRITREISSSLDQDRVLDRALELVNEVVNATQGIIMMLDKAEDEFIFRASFGVASNFDTRDKPAGLKADEGLAGWVVTNREAVIVHNTKTDDRWVERPRTSEHHSAIAVPLIVDDEVQGVMMLLHLEQNAFTQEQLSLVGAAANQVSNAIYNAHLYQLSRRQAVRLAGLLMTEQLNAAKTQAMLESIADGVLVADESGELIVANDAIIDILGVPRSQLLGRNFEELSGLYGQLDETLIATINQWADLPPKEIDGKQYMSEQITIDHGKIVSVHLSPVVADDRFAGTVSIVRDITRDVEVDRVKSEFVSTVSHELRTPLTSIKGYTDLILMGATGQISDSSRRYLNVIKNNADRLQELVNDLLDISRIETGKTKLDRRPMDIALVAGQVVNQHLRGRIEHDKKEINVSLQIEPNLPMVSADQARVTQILTNLVDNAFNYTEENGNIWVSAYQKEDDVFVTVKDTGIGISPENFEKIFDRFYRSDDARVQRVSGTGLGLAIVQSLIEMHGGELQVESQPEQGSTFTFNLPRVLEEADLI